MGYFTETADKIFRIVLRRLASKRISYLADKTDWGSRFVAQVLLQTLQNDATPEEKAWLIKIESLRKKLKSSRDEITIVDYGAAKADRNSTGEPNGRSKIVTRTVGTVCRKAGTPYFWGFFLFKLIREFKPSVCLELGTSLGISASFQAAALKLNQSGKLVTLEGAKSLASLAQRNFHSLGLDNVSVITGRFQDTLDGVLNDYAPVNYAFIDGHHDEKATLAYFQQIVPFLSNSAILVFDDISWSRGMKRAWENIEMDNRIKLSLNLWHMGIGILDRKIERKQRFKIPMV